MKQISVPPSEIPSTAAVSEGFSQTASAAIMPSGPKDQPKGASEEKKKDKTEKKGNSTKVM